MQINLDKKQDLFRLANSSKPEDRQILGQSVAQLLGANLSKGERFLVEDILMRMLREAESEMRQALARELALQPDCPTALLDFLIYECPLEDCEVLLKHGEALQEDYLLNIAHAFLRPQYWRIIAGRKEVKPTLALYLVHTDDNETQMILVRNGGVTFCSDAMQHLAQKAVNFHDLQEPLLHRPEITSSLAMKFYLHAAEHLQKEMQKRFFINEKTVRQSLELVLKGEEKRRAIVRTIPMEMLGMVRKLPRIPTRQLVEAMQKHDLALFACLCGVKLGVNPEKVLMGLEEQPTYTLAVLCKANHMTRMDYNSMYLVLRQILGSNQHMTAMDLKKATAVYETTKIDQVDAQLTQWGKAP